jgi:hypothetical protein
VISPEVVSQLVVIVSAVWYSSRGVVKRLGAVEEKLDKLPCSGCTPPRPKIVVLKGDRIHGAQ